MKQEEYNELMNRIKPILDRAEVTPEELEEIADNVTITEDETETVEEWKTKYNDLETKYKKRFFNAPTEEKKKEEKKEDTKIKYEDLWQ